MKADEDLIRRAMQKGDGRTIHALSNLICKYRFNCHFNEKELAEIRERDLRVFLATGIVCDTA